MKKEVKDPIYARYLVYLTRPFPDFDFFFIKPIRRKAVESLMLKPGDRVLDAGCGSGGSFRYLLESVGTSGEIIGLDISPGTIINTNKRIQKNNWQNVKAVEANAQTVKLNGKFEGLLMFAAPDVFASEKALSNILPYLKENTRIAFFGAKISKRRFGWLLNGLLRLSFSKLSFPSGPQLEEKPWITIEKHLTKIEVKEYFFGWMFLANGILSFDKSNNGSL